MNYKHSHTQTADYVRRRLPGGKVRGTFLSLVFEVYDNELSRDDFANKLNELVLSLGDDVASAGACRIFGLQLSEFIFGIKG